MSKQVDARGARQTHGLCRFALKSCYDRGVSVLLPFSYFSPKVAVNILARVPRAIEWSGTTESPPSRKVRSAAPFILWRVWEGKHFLLLYKFKFDAVKEVTYHDYYMYVCCVGLLWMCLVAQPSSLFHFFESNMFLFTFVFPFLVASCILLHMHG